MTKEVKKTKVNSDKAVKATKKKTAKEEVVEVENLKEFVDEIIRERAEELPQVEEVVDNAEKTVVEEKVEIPCEIHTEENNNTAKTRKTRYYEGFAWNGIEYD